MVSLLGQKRVINFNLKTVKVVFDSHAKGTSLFTSVESIRGLGVVARGSEEIIPMHEECRLHGGLVGNSACSGLL